MNADIDAMKFNAHPLKIKVAKLDTPFHSMQLRFAGLESLMAENFANGSDSNVEGMNDPSMISITERLSLGQERDVAKVYRASVQVIDEDDHKGCDVDKEKDKIEKLRLSLDTTLSRQHSSMMTNSPSSSTETSPVVFRSKDVSSNHDKNTTDRTNEEISLSDIRNFM
jgi:hypothetical protein